MSRRAFGFAFAEGGPVGIKRCIAVAGNSDILAPGDAVVLVGSTTGGAALGNGPVVPAIARAAATGALYGFVVCTEPASATSPNFNNRHRPASTAMYILVQPFKTGVEYLIQADGALALEDIGENANLATIADADTTLGLSKMQLSASSVATSQTGYQMTICGPQEDGSNAMTDSTPVVRVTINTIQKAADGFAGI